MTKNSPEIEMIRYIVVSGDWYVKTPTEGTGNLGERVIYPYQHQIGFFLKGFQDADRALVYEYGPFKKLDDIEAFAKERGIVLDTTP
jgi:hypothetical protein